MIPKKIHYCWFGKKELPQSAIDCIDSWKKYLPDFEIKCWNESNFDINSHQFVKECYQVKKYGFIVDVLRAYVLMSEGGIYLDTDVEFIKSLDDSMLNCNSFISYEVGDLPNVGLVASEKDGEFITSVYDLYKEKKFINEDGSFNQKFTGPIGFKHVLENYNLILDGQFQKINNLITIYPQEYFSPKNYYTGLTIITKNTYAIHHYDASWVDDKINFIQEQKISRINYYMNIILEEEENKDVIIDLLKKKWIISNSYLFKYSISDYLNNLKIKIFKK